MPSNNKNKKFFFNWVLYNELAIGPVPKTEDDLDLLKNEGIKSVLTLCSKDEFKLKKKLSIDFHHEYFPLPDHKNKDLIKEKDILNALKILEKLSSYKPTFVHCYAAVERSPLVCILWLMKKEKISFQEALDYLSSIHPTTNPLPEQLEIVKKVKC